MYEKLTFHISGLTPTIMHNGRLANPLDSYSKAIKEISGKKKKTDADFAAMARLEWEASFYLDEKGRPCWPGENIERMVVDAAKKSKQGQSAKAGVYCDGLWPVKYNGPTDFDALWADENYRLCVGAKVNQSRVMRTRPIFHKWALEFDLHYLPDVVGPKELTNWVTLAGSIIGLSEWRPKFGKFEVVQK